MFRSKGKDEFNDHIRTVEYCVLNQEYIIESSSLFIDSIIEEGLSIKEEGRRIKDKSNKFIEIIGDDSNSSTDFASCSKMFAKFFEIVGHLVSQHYSNNLEQENHKELQIIIDDLKDFNKEINKSTLVEKFKTLTKMRTILSKKQDLYEKSISNAEDVLLKSKEVLNDPTNTYELSVKETAREKAKNALKTLRNKEGELQEYINQVNEHQKS